MIIIQYEEYFQGSTYMIQFLDPIILLQLFQFIEMSIRVMDFFNLNGKYFW